MCNNSKQSSSGAGMRVEVGFWWNLKEWKGT